MANIIAFVTLVSSMTGLAYLISRKVPALLNVPKQSDGSLVETFKNGVEDSTVFKWFSSRGAMAATFAPTGPALQTHG